MQNFRVALCVCLLTMLWCGNVWSQTNPRPNELPSSFSSRDRVNDLGSVLGTTKAEREATKRRLSQALKAIESRASGTQIGFLSLPKFDGDEQVFALAVARHWGLGRAGYSTDGKNNGILVFAYPARDGDGKVVRHNMRIEVGSGLEGALPDGKAGSIMREHMHLAKDGNFGPAVERIVGELATAIFAEYKVTKETPRHEIKGDSKDRFDSMLWVFLGIYIVTALVGFIHWMLGTAVGGIGGAVAAMSIYGSAAVGTIAFCTILGLILGSVAWFLIQVVGIPGLGGGGSSSDSMSAGGGGFSGGGASGNS